AFVVRFFPVWPVSFAVPEKIELHVKEIKKLNVTPSKKEGNSTVFTLSVGSLLHFFKESATSVVSCAHQSAKDEPHPGMHCDCVPIQSPSGVCLTPWRFRPQGRHNRQ